MSGMQGTPPYPASPPTGRPRTSVPAASASGVGSSAHRSGSFPGRSLGWAVGPGRKGCAGGDAGGGPRSVGADREAAGGGSGSGSVGERGGGRSAWADGVAALWRQALPEADSPWVEELKVAPPAAEPNGPAYEASTRCPGPTSPPASGRETWPEPPSRAVLLSRHRPRVLRVRRWCAADDSYTPSKTPLNRSAMRDG